MFKESVFAIVGCGIGGATMAALLQKQGYRVTVYEQAAAFIPAGTGIHITPNAMKVLRHLGLEPELNETGFAPASFTSRAWDTGEVLFSLPLNNTPALYDGSYLTIHRGAFHGAIVNKVQPGTIQYNKRLKDITQYPDQVVLTFDDATTACADFVIGADGFHSVLRRCVADQSVPVYSGYAAFRAIVPAHRLRSEPLDGLTKWWGHDRFIISYFLSKRKDHFYFAAGIPVDQWKGNSHREATLEELLSGFEGFHPAVQSFLQVSEQHTLWPLFERPAINNWYHERIVLLGDASHPMLPHMAQGAVMAIEDAAVLIRCLDSAGNADWQTVTARYAHNRQERIKRIKEHSSENTWLKTPMDPAWVFAYDAWKAPLVQVTGART
ncbi:NAD(P)-binding protein [Chitinophaga sp. Mgbs1]|uniref:NAD(P)-binding protein n=1 Tax=Chitinophaga solisilvae TaxID=1233460 RepID=A0A433WNC1_9BACT|nr:NAD(P)-binding protein [Chitinophaga solisilvae]